MPSIGANASAGSFKTRRGSDNRGRSRASGPPPARGRSPCDRPTEYEWAYLWAAVEPATGASVAMITPTVNTELMNLFLQGLSGTLGADEHAVLVLDNAGWHVAKALTIPANVTLLFLPPYSPELNPVERLWAWLRGHQLSNRIYLDYAELLHETDRAWATLDDATIKSVCACPWIERALQA
jgi:transposase